MKGSNLEQLGVFFEGERERMLKVINYLRRVFLMGLSKICCT